MSLLLDALKRAEDAKRAKAEAAAGSPVGSEESAAPVGESPASSKSPIDLPAAQPQTDTNEGLSPLSAGLDSAPPLEIPVLSLEVIDEKPATATAQVGDTPTAPLRSESANTPMSLEALLDSELGVDRRKGEAAAPTSAATAAFRAARLQSSPPPAADLPAPFIASPPISISIEPMAISAVTTTTAETPQQASNREAIKNAFAVKHAAQSSPKPRWILPLAGVVVAAISAGSWYVWTEMNRFNKPAVARLSPMPPAPAQPTPTPSTSAPAAGQVTSDTNKAASSTAEQPIAVAKSAASKAEDDIAALPPLLPPPATQLKEERAATAPKVVSATPREAFARRIEALPPTSAISSPEKVFLKPATAVAPQISPSLSAGYTALAAGDYVTAKRRYAEAISSNYNSADAHLGFATAAARSGDTGDVALAIRHYQRVLEIDPRNSTARAALIVLAGGPNDAGGASIASAKEAELKLLILQDPGAANAHFLLGSLYAEAKRWRDAQQAFFEAAKLVPQNADYSYNLAVSLDHLGQPAAAANFYRRALAATTKGQFDVATVERRIALLTANASDVAAKR